MRSTIAAVAAVLLAATASPAHAATHPHRAPSYVTRTMPGDPHRNSPWAWEPGLTRGPDGAVWSIGNHCAIVDQRGVCQVEPSRPGFEPDYTPVWRSTDRGRHYRWAGDPLRAVESHASLPSPNAQLAQDHPGGYDTDIAVAPRRRSGAQPALVYAVSAFEGGSTLAVSADNGHHWSVASLAGVPLQDRPWLAASGPCDLYLQYHPVTGAYNVLSVARVDHYDGCALAGSAVAGHAVAKALTTTYVAPPLDEVTASNSVMAKIVAEGGKVYVAYRACATIGADLNCDAPGDHQTLHVAISRDRAATFSDVSLPDDHAHGPLDDGVWPVTAAADGAGHVAVASSDIRHVRLWTSSSGGQRWRLRAGTVDRRPGGFATVPTLALSGRRMALAWYGSPPARRGVPQHWRLALARSNDGGAHFSHQTLDPELATTATGEPLGDKLYDNFGALLTPRGELALTYTQSCDGHRPADLSCPGAAEGVQAHTLVVRSAWLPAPPTRHRRHHRHRYSKRAATPRIVAIP